MPRATQTGCTPIIGVRHLGVAGNASSGSFIQRLRHLPRDGGRCADGIPPGKHREYLDATARTRNNTHHVARYELMRSAHVSLIRAATNTHSPRWSHPPDGA